MNRCALENVRTDLLIKKNLYKDLEKESIKENRIYSQIEMYRDMSELYLMLLKQLDS